MDHGVDTMTSQQAPETIPIICFFSRKVTDWYWRYFQHCLELTMPHYTGTVHNSSDETNTKR